jgi:hypothetical protein
MMILLLHGIWSWGIGFAGLVYFLMEHLLRGRKTNTNNALAGTRVLCSSRLPITELETPSLCSH